MSFIGKIRPCVGDQMEFLKKSVAFLHNRDREK